MQNAIPSMKWQEVELLLGEAFRLQGYIVTDRGLDMALQKDDERFLVQCKHWQAAKVEVAAVRELFAVMAATGAAGGFVVTSGEFTKEARDFAEACNVRLIDGTQLAAMLDKARQTLTMPPRIEPRLAAGPACPRCSRTMMQQVAQQGSNAGKPFWGCPAFPDCRGTLPI
jgi:restriction system protein